MKKLLNEEISRNDSAKEKSDSLNNGVLTVSHQPTLRQGNRKQKLRHCQKHLQQK